MARNFDALVAGADTGSVHGWDFSWLDGRATAATLVAWWSSPTRTSRRCRLPTRRPIW